MHLRFAYRLFVPNDVIWMSKITLCKRKGEQGTAELGAKTVLKKKQMDYVSRDRSYLPLL